MCRTFVALFQYKRVAEEAIARANVMKDEYALAAIERSKKEEEDRQLFRANVMKHAQQLVRTTQHTRLASLFAC